MRRRLQQAGVEVVDLGRPLGRRDRHAGDRRGRAGDRGQLYEGGDLEFFKYMVDLLRDRDAGHIRAFGGGGGVIVAPEIRELEAYGVERIYAPEDGQRLGLEVMSPTRRVAPVSTWRTICRCRWRVWRRRTGGCWRGWRPVWRTGRLGELAAAIGARARGRRVAVIGVTGTGGAGKSSLTDELICRFRLDRPEIVAAVIAIDPSRRRTGGALLGDRIRMNAIGGMLGGGSVYMLSPGRGPRAARCPVTSRDRRSVQGGGLRTHYRGDAGHRPGRCGGDGSRRLVALRDDARVRRRQPAREDRDARPRRHRGDPTSSTARAARTRCATCASSCSATARRSPRRPRAFRCTARSRRGSTTTG